MRASRLLLALCLTGILVAADRQVEVADVRVEGCKLVHPDRIRFLTAVRAGRHYNGVQELQLALADDVRAIERMGPFTNTTSQVVWGDDSSKVTVVYKVTELPYVAAIRWQGLDDLGWGVESDLKKVMETKVGGYGNPLIVDNDLRAIERHFRDKGHRGATARYEYKQTPAGVELTIFVDVPRAVKVGRVDYRGLPAYQGPFGITKRRLDDMLEKSQVNRPGRPWQPELLPIDQSDVARVLADEGWLDCRLTGLEIEHADFVRPLEDRRRIGPTFVPDGNYDDRVHLVYALEPGERYRLGKVSFVGNTIVGGDELRQAFTMSEGDWFRRDDVAHALERSRRVISNRGYARCRFNMDRRPDLASRTVDLVVMVDEGRQYHVGRIDIRGNEISRDSVARRAIVVEPGQLWNDDDKDESRRQILRSGLFKDGPRRALDLRPEFPEDRPDQADLIVDVDEDSTGSLSVQVGYSSSTGVFGQFGYTERNFDLFGALSDPAGQWRGNGEILDFNVNLAQERNSLTAAWTNPSVGDGPYSLTVGGARVDSTQRAWDQLSLTGSAGIGRGFFRNDLRLGLNYAYTDYRFSNIALDAPDDAVPGSRFINTVGLSATWDRLDNPRLPTRGVRFVAVNSLSGEILSATDPVNEYSLKGDGFMPLLESEDGGVTFIHLGANWRQVSAAGGAAGVPFYQRYLGGGDSPRHRGFAYNKLSPIEINKNGYVSYVGGDRDFISTIELSYPLQGTNEGVRGVIFADVGNVWGEDADASIRDLRTAWGFGVRFPMQFPISLDFAWLVGPKDGQPDTQVHFGIGQVRF